MKHLTREEQTFILNKIRIDIIEFLNENQYTKAEKTKYIQKLIQEQRGKSDPYSLFYVERLKLEIEYLTPEKPKKNTLSDLITHKESKQIVSSIKVQCKNIKGKQLSLLLRALQDLGLIPTDRIAKKFHEACKKEFDWDIASYNAMNGYRFNDITDTDDLENMKQSIRKLL